jgi:DNA segregation ATPase FtsK/SpoIIIE-like protein
MTFQKCNRCKLHAKESSKAFYKRTSVSFKVPFICAACLKILASIKSPNFKPHVVHPKVKKAKPVKKRTLENLDVSEEICALHAEYGCLSIAFLQRRLKMGYHEAERIIKLIQDHLNEH